MFAEMQVTASIPARSRQQALDWSLVLVSQGIESTIEPAMDGPGWQLVVAQTDCQRAIQAIRQYKMENRTPLWRQTVPWTGLIFDWRSVAWCAFLLVLFAYGESHSRFVKAGLMDRQAVWSGEWWRLFTAVTLHRDLHHLLSNLVAGVLLLGLAMGAFGSGVGLLAAYLAGVGGNVAGLLLHPGEYHSLCASGMIFGALGLLSWQMFSLSRTDGVSARQMTIRRLMSGVFLLILLGLSENSDVIAHVGGFGSGIVFGALLARWPNLYAGNKLINRLAELLCIGLVILTWWRALV